VGGEIFHMVKTGSTAHEASCTVGLFPRSKAAGDVALITHLLLAPRLRKE